MSKKLGELAHQDILDLLSMEGVLLKNQVNLKTSGNGQFTALQIYPQCGILLGSRVITCILFCKDKVTLRGLRKEFPQHKLRTVKQVNGTAVVLKAYKDDTVDCFIQSVKALIYLAEKYLPLEYL